MFSACLKCIFFVSVQDHENSNQSLGFRLQSRKKRPINEQGRPGKWRELLQSTSEEGRRSEVRRILKDMRSSALPRVAAQRTYQVAVNGLPVGHRVGSHACPRCGPRGHHPLMDSQVEDCEHVVAGCQVSRLLWALVLTQWAAHVDAQEWTRELTAHQTTSTLTNQARRALILGQRPAGQQQHPQAFALLRGLVLASLIDHRNECAVSPTNTKHTYASRHRRKQASSTAEFAGPSIMQSCATSATPKHQNNTTTSAAASFRPFLQRDSGATLGRKLGSHNACTAIPSKSSCQKHHQSNNTPHATQPHHRSYPPQHASSTPMARAIMHAKNENHTILHRKPAGALWHSRMAMGAQMTTRKKSTKHGGPLLLTRTMPTTSAPREPQTTQPNSVLSPTPSRGRSSAIQIAKSRSLFATIRPMLPT